MTKVRLLICSILHFKIILNLCVCFYWIQLTIVIVVFAAIAVAESAFGEKSVKYSRSGPMKTTFNNRKRDNSYLSPFVADHPEVQHHSEDYHHTPAVTYSDATPAVYETHHHSDDYISSHKPTIYSSAPAAVYDDGHHHTPSAVVDAHHDDYHYKTAAHSAAPTVYEAQHQHHSDDYSHSKPATYAHDEKTYSSVSLLLSYSVPLIYCFFIYFTNLFDYRLTAAVILTRFPMPSRTIITTMTTDTNRRAMRWVTSRVLTTSSYPTVALKSSLTSPTATDTALMSNTKASPNLMNTLNLQLPTRLPLALITITPSTIKKMLFLKLLLLLIVSDRLFRSPNR